MRVKGSITVFVSLLLVVMLSVTSAFCESIRFRGARVSGICAADAACESALAKYDRKLLDEFGVLGSYFDSIDEFKSEFINNIERIQHPEKEFMFINNSDFWKLSVEDVELNEYCLMTDNIGAAFFEQGVLYSKDHLGVGILDIMMSYGENNQSPENIDDYFKQEESKTDEQIEKYSNTDGSEATYEYTGDVIELDESPVDTVKAIKKGGILSLVIPADKQLSSTEIDLGKVLSNRALSTGIVNNDSQKEQLDKLLYINYICNKLQCFTRQNPKESNIQYKLEYCIGGKASDRDNLAYVVNRLLLMREATNFSYLLTDSAKKAQAMAVAVGIVGVTGIEPLVEAVKYAILLAWAYGESIVDVKNLLNGGSVALVKSAENWKLGIENIGNISSSATEPIKENNGLEYNDYLKLLMLFLSIDDLVMRSLDMVEKRMQELYDTDCYFLDRLIVAVEAVVSYNSSPLFLNFRYLNGYGYNSKYLVTTKYKYV